MCVCVWITEPLLIICKRMGNILHAFLPLPPLNKTTVVLAEISCSELRKKTQSLN